MRIIVSLLLLVLSSNLYSQKLRGKYEFDSDFTIAGGLKIQRILFDDFGTASLQPDAEDERNFVGGGFAYFQPGAEVLLTYYTGKEKKWRVPFSLAYTPFKASQIRYINSASYFRFIHELDLYQFSIGAQYSLVTLPLASAKIYLGPTLQYNLVDGQTYSVETVFILDPDASSEDITRPKPNANRLGLNFEIGADGVLEEDFMINLKCGFGIYNMLFYDDGRAELFAPGFGGQTGESSVFNFNFSFLVQYKL